MFTQRHYQKIAEWLSEAPFVKPIRVKMATYLAKKFEEDSSKFKPHLFYLACGLEKTAGEAYAKQKEGQG